MVSESTLDTIEEEAKRLTKLQAKHQAARNDWAKLRTTAQGQRGRQHVAFQAVAGHAHAVMRSHRRISALLDGDET